MDKFNLRWPGGDATLHTDGARCRVVWRAANGIGGVIDNTDQAKRRVAGGLAYAPTLLEELRTAGYGELAGEVERTAPPVVEAAPVARPTVPKRQPTPERGALPEHTERQAPRVGRWLEGLAGDAAFETCGVRRASKWHHGKTWPDGLALKPPHAGDGGWVLKILGDETRYFAAAEFRGVCACLVSQKSYANPEFLSAFFEGCRALRHKEVQIAKEAWEAVVSRDTT